jgi:hypothetical protein
MDFLKLHIKGRPALWRLNSIEGVLPATDAKGKYLKGSYVVSNMEGMSQHVDETMEEIEEALAFYEVEIEGIEVANEDEEPEEAQAASPAE